MQSPRNGIHLYILEMVIVCAVFECMLTNEGNPDYSPFDGL